MKVFAACCVALLLVSASCKKNTTPPSQSLLGTWELRDAQRGMSPNVSYPPGNMNILKFTSNTYSISVNGQVKKTGTYTIAEDHSFDALVVPQGQYIHRVDYQDSTGFKIFFQVDGDKLTFLSGVFALDSGTALRYARVSGN